MHHRVAHLDTRRPTVEEDSADLEFQHRKQGSGLVVVGLVDVQRGGELTLQITRDRGDFGGIDTPVALATVPITNKAPAIYMAVWAAGTGVTRNGATPNYAFRVSAVDTLVDVKLLDYAAKKFGSKRAHVTSRKLVTRDGI